MVSSNDNADKIPLAIDVDGTLTPSDLLLESSSKLLSTRPYYLFLIPFWWLLKGRPYLKKKVAELAPFSGEEEFIFNPSVLAEIEKAQREGREVCLASGSNEKLVEKVAQKVKVEKVFASNDKVNLTGQKKANLLVEKLGENGFDYMGNEKIDLKVWKYARQIIGVGLTSSLKKKVALLEKPAHFLPALGNCWRDYLRLIRPHQWIKNLLVFVPLVAAHETEVVEYGRILLFFVAFSLLASATYIWNDFLDIFPDRSHPSKRQKRPLATGRVNPFSALKLSLVLLVLAFILSATLSLEALMGIVLYLGVTCSYSLYFKRELFIDVIVLALLYTIRIFSGAMASDIELSPWAIMFSIFTSMALAMVKGQKEINLNTSPKGRKYNAQDGAVMVALSSGASFAGAIVLSLYINSEQANIHYTSPHWLWPICILFSYWMGRIILLANRSAIDDDPVVFTITDKTSWITCLLSIFFFALAL